MTIHDLLSSQLTKLPKKQPPGTQFREYFISVLNAFGVEAKTVDFPKEIIKDELLKKLDTIIKGLVYTINAYYRGSPFDAYRRLRDTINESSIENYWDNHNLLDNRNFYRIRTVNTNYPLSKKDLFHIPFHLRENIATQRYSIPGFPSLYLSNTVYVAWEELRRPNLDLIHAARFVNKRPLKLIDLTTTRYVGKYEVDEIEQIKTDFLMWPFIVACSIKVKNHSSSFKPEYIIPQLLLQWVRNNKMISRNNNQPHGIKFSSTHIDLNETKSKGDFFNIVIPVIENKEMGYCNKVSNLFQMTEVLSWQLYEFSMSAPGVAFMYTRNEMYNNADIKQIEMIKDRNIPYGFSPLSKLEVTLRGMGLSDVKF